MSTIIGPVSHHAASGPNTKRETPHIAVTSATPSRKSPATIRRMLQRRRAERARRSPRRWSSVGAEEEDHDSIDDVSAVP